MTTVYQHGTLAQLMAKQMAGTITVGELLTHGDTGIGTLDGLDGEVIILNGDVYQADSTGAVNHITDKETTLPFASVHFDQPDISYQLPFNATTYQNLSSQLTEKQIDNVFSALKLHGHFTHIHVRVAPKQTKPYPSLLTVAQHQPEFETRDVQGTLVGYYAPAVFGGATAAGWHLHFLADDHQFAGHVLDFEADDMVGSLLIFDEFEQHLPIDNHDFRAMKQDMAGLQDGIEASEGGRK